MDNLIFKAKRMFISSNCSLFEMARENQIEYEQYLRFGISKNLENEWREEQLEKYYNDILNNNIEQWYIFIKMYELVESIKNENSLSMLENVIVRLKGNLDDKSKIIIAETIVGRRTRKVRSGLIYISYDLGYKLKAQSFGYQCLELVDNLRVNSIFNQRAVNTWNLCIDIMTELSIRDIV